MTRIMEVEIDVKKIGTERENKRESEREREQERKREIERDR